MKEIVKKMLSVDVVSSIFPLVEFVLRKVLLDFLCRLSVFGIKRRGV